MAEAVPESAESEPTMQEAVEVNITRNDGQGTVWLKLTVQEEWTMGTAIAHALSMFGVELPKLEFAPGEPRVGNFFWIRPSSPEFNGKELQDVTELFHDADLIVCLQGEDVIPNRVYGVGAGADWQLGLPKGQAARATKPGAGFALPIDIPGLANRRVTQVACGTAHSVFISLDGHAYSCGEGAYGQLGHLPSTQQSAPDGEPIGRRASQGTIVYRVRQPRRMALHPKAHAVQVSAGSEHTSVLCALGARGEGETVLYTCGRGSGGRLGHAVSIGATGDSAPNEFLPREVITLSHVPLAMAACGDTHMAAVSRSGRLYTWGSGQLGHVMEERVEGAQGADGGAGPEAGETRASAAGMLKQTSYLSRDAIADLETLAALDNAAPTGPRAHRTRGPSTPAGGTEDTSPTGTTQPAFLHDLPTPDSQIPHIGRVEQKRFYSELWPTFGVHAMVVPHPSEAQLLHLAGRDRVDLPPITPHAVAAEHLRAASASGSPLLSGGSIGSGASTPRSQSRLSVPGHSRVGSFSSALSHGTATSSRAMEAVVKAAQERGAVMRQLRAEGFNDEAADMARFTGPVLGTLLVDTRYDRRGLNLLDANNGMSLAKGVRRVCKRYDLRREPRLFFVRRDVAVQATPREVVLLRGRRALHVSCGSEHTAVVVESLTAPGKSTDVLTFGEGAKGELGYIVRAKERYGMADTNPTRHTQHVPREVPGLVSKGILKVYFSGDARLGARGYKPPRDEEQNEAPGCGNFVFAPFHLSMLSSVVHIAAGYHCSVFVDSTGKVLVSGTNTTGRLGLGEEGGQRSVREVEHLRGHRVVGVAVSRAHAATQGHVLLLSVNYLSSADQLEVQEKIRNMEETDPSQLQLFTRREIVQQSLSKSLAQRKGAAYDPYAVPVDSDDEDDIAEIRTRTRAAVGQDAQGAALDPTVEQQRAAGLAVSDKPKGGTPGWGGGDSGRGKGEEGEEEGCTVV